jgi:hypothetical protein
MTGRHRIVVSLENKTDHAWQAKLFHYSCVTRLNHQATFVVHENGTAWHPDFAELARAGAIVRRAPSYCTPTFPPTRNFPGTLIHAAAFCASDQFIVLCDPDMIFATKPEFYQGFSAAYYSYMNYDEPPVQAAAKRLGIPRTLLRARHEQVRCGVPYVIPADRAERLGQEWLTAFDAFRTEGRNWNDVWLDVMYAFGLAVMRLGWTLALADLMTMDHPAGIALERDIIHYCHGEPAWNKRWYMTPEQSTKVWDPPFQPQPGTVLCELFLQLRQALNFYRNPYFDGPDGRSKDSAYFKSTGSGPDRTTR